MRGWQALWEHPQFQQLMEQLRANRDGILENWKSADFESTYARTAEQGDLQRLEWLLNRKYENE